jgi:hypothetical protein
MFLLSGKMHSEFLAVPELVRLELPSNGNSNPSLLLKTNTLNLKYLAHSRNLTLIIDRLMPAGFVFYAVKIDDDPESQALVWSIAETENELEAIHLLFNHKQCEIFLFNEGAVNVCETTTNFKIYQPNEMETNFANSKLGRSEDESLLTIVEERVNELHLKNFIGVTTFTPVSNLSWLPISATYITMQAKSSNLDLFNSNEGEQQESLALWLTDELSIEGSVRGPLILEEKGPRELTDLFFQYEKGCFLIESKTLSIFSRPKLPSRTKLKRDIVKGVTKAVRQLAGACKNLRRGLKVTTPEEDEIQIDRSFFPHCIILVPDLTLFDEQDGLGGKFLRKFLEENNAYLHILDPSALLRSVQHGLELSGKSEIGFPPIMTFDVSLLTRWKHALEIPTPNIDFIMRNQEP